MPKIIENLEQRLKDAAKEQIREVGYAEMTIRSVATACGIGVGTVYNYYPSKDALLAAWMLDDWNESIADIDQIAARENTAQAVARSIYDALMDFAFRHAAIFRDEAAMLSFSRSYRRNHSALRAQLAAPLRRFCPDDFTAEFVAEGLLSWAMAGRDFDVIWGLLQKLF